MVSTFLRAYVWALTVAALLITLACGDDDDAQQPPVVGEPSLPSNPPATTESRRSIIAPPMPRSPLAQPLATRKVVMQDAGVEPRRLDAQVKVVEKAVTKKIIVRENASTQVTPPPQPARNEVAGRGSNADPADEVAEALQPGQKPKGNTDAVEEVAGEQSPNFDPPEEIAGQ